MRPIASGLSVVMLLLLIVGSAGTQAPASSAGIFVADAGNNRIVRLDDMTGTGWSTLGGPGPRKETNQFSDPRGVALDTAGRIYVSDAGNNRIVRVDDMTGAAWTTLGTAASRSVNGQTRRGTNQFAGLRSIFVDAAGRIHTAEYEIYPNGRIVRMNNMDGAGWIAFGTNGGSPRNKLVKEDIGPNGIFVDATGRIYVADIGGNRIIRMNDMTGAGWIGLGCQVLRGCRSEGSGVKQFRGPSGIVVDAAGRIYVADFGNHRIVRMKDLTGRGWTTLGTQGDGNRQFTLISSIALDTTGRIYVADFGNNRIVRVNDMTGAGWTTLGSQANGKNQFSSPRGIFVR